MKLKPLSKSQAKVVDKYKEFVLQKGYMPSMEEVAKELGVSRTSVWRLYNQAKEKGWEIKMNYCPTCGHELKQELMKYKTKKTMPDLAEGAIFEYDEKKKYFSGPGNWTFSKETIEKNPEWFEKIN